MIRRAWSLDSNLKPLVRRMPFGDSSVSSSQKSNSKERIEWRLAAPMEQRKRWRSYIEENMLAVWSSSYLSRSK